MKKIKIIAVPFVVLTTIAIAFAFTSSNTISKEKKIASVEEKTDDKQIINLFVTHGHCSLPFGGVVSELNVTTHVNEDAGNPLEDMKVSFTVDPNTFNACRGDDLTARIKTPGLFIDEEDEKITFTSTNVYTMGIDWYQINGKMAIKGIEKEVKFFATGIRNPEETMANFLVIEGQVDLYDWGIDYDKIVNGVSSEVPTKWLHLNMKIDMKKDRC